MWASFGTLPERAVPTAVAQLAVMPDGASLDAEGALWVADSRNSRLIRVREGGEILTKSIQAWAFSPACLVDLMVEPSMPV